MLSLRLGNVHAALGADDDLAYLVTRLRRVWPDVVLYFRGDCAFGVPDMYDVCEQLNVLYTFGLSTNLVVRNLTTIGANPHAGRGGWRTEQSSKPNTRT